MGRALASKTPCDWIDFAGLTIIGIYAAGCARFSSDFSELHVSLAFLPFPIFMGEIVIAGCLGLLALKQRLDPAPMAKWQKYLWIYLLLVVGKALWDFGQWGAYAFRNAAMFYYPVFILFVYAFYNPRYFSGATKLFLAVVLFGLCSVFSGDIYYWLTCAALFAVVVRRLEPPVLRWIMIGAFLVLGDYRDTFSGSRTNVIGSAAAVIFLMYVYVRYFLKSQGRTKVLAVAVMSLILGLAIFFSGDKNGLKSMCRLKDIGEMYAYSKAQIEVKRSGYVPATLDVELYNDNRQARKMSLEELALASPPPPAIETTLIETAAVEPLPAAVAPAPTGPAPIGISPVPAVSVEPPQIFQEPPVQEAVVPSSGPSGAPQAAGDTSLAGAPVVEDQALFLEYGPAAIAPNPDVFAGAVQRSARAQAVETSGEPKPNVVDELTKKMFQPDGGRDLYTAQTNVVFRIFIWQDMWEELVRRKALLGVGFGQPQRSQSLEILHWGTSEWKRDGWITAHNSFFHAVYRLGIVGLALVLILFVCIFRLARDFVRGRSFTGVLLVSILLYWIAAANTLVILELPHYAIPFWSVLGLALVYRRRMRMSLGSR